MHSREDRPKSAGPEAPGRNRPIQHQRRYSRDLAMLRIRNCEPGSRRHIPFSRLVPNATHLCYRLIWPWIINPGSAKQPLLHLYYQTWGYIRIDQNPLLPTLYHPHWPNMPSCRKSHYIRQHPHRVPHFIPLPLLVSSALRQSRRKRNECCLTTRRHIPQIYRPLH